jgi:DNA-binding transcriptional ArsR family regulator
MPATDHLVANEESRSIDIFLYGNMIHHMARAATTSDAFNAIAEPNRRAILTLLRGNERPVGDVALSLGLNQPAASKHLKVLREVGLVYARRAGKQKLYGLDARGLEPVHTWTGGFEEFWSESFDRLDEYVKELQREEQSDGETG